MTSAAPEPPAPRLWTSESELRQAIPLGGTRIDQLLWLQNEFDSFNAWEDGRTCTPAIVTAGNVLRAVVDQEVAAFKAEMGVTTKEVEATHTPKKPVTTGSGPVQSAVSSTSTGGSVAVPMPFCAPASDRPSTFGPVTESGSQFGRPAYPSAPPPPANNGLPPFWPSVASQFPSSIANKSSGSATAHLMGDHYRGPFEAHPYGGWPSYHQQFSHSPLAAAASSQVESSSQPSTASVGQTVAINKSAASAVVASDKEEKAMATPVTESSTAPVGSLSESRPVHK